MDKKGIKKRHKRKMGNMCVYSGKPIGCKDAVLVEHARDYLKEIGFLVSKKPIMLFFLSLFLIFCLSFISSSESLRASYTSDDNANIHVFGSSWTAQSFNNTNSTFEITSIKLKLYKAGTPGTMNVYLMGANNTGFPNNTILSNGTFNGESLTTDSNGEWYEINMSSYILQQYSIYTITFNCTDGSSASDDINWRVSTAHTYSGGISTYTSNSGALWNDYSAIDSLFQVFGTTNECNENLINSSWSSYINSSCNSSNLYLASKYLTQYDANFCGASNITFWSNNTYSCDFCTPELTNITLEDWYDITLCVNDTKTQNSTLEEYDLNFCGEYENITYYLQRESSCFSSNLALFQVDLESKVTSVMLILTYLSAFILLFLGIFIFSGSLFIVLGFILLFSEFNIIISVLSIVGGVLVLFLTKR